MRRLMVAGSSYEKFINKQKYGKMCFHITDDSTL
jgi:hypothetical protein